MTTIEEKIVSMGFDNSNFEKHAAQSLATLEKIESALGTLGSVSGGTLENALEAISNKFSILGTIGDEVLRKLADGLVNVANQGLSLAKSLSIDQITAGWSKYADKTQAVQTIMAATSKDWTDTGAQMEYVSNQLDKLNWFTDETSYSFLDMVNNIGKFTSNGIGLEESVTAMEGISTWAAISGANVQEAGRAMYNLSQALATGSVKLMDWKSIENANMATREFKETALETAVSLGTLTKSIDAEGKAVYKTAKNHEFYAEQFNTYLSDAWFSKEVLTSTLKQYGEYSNVLHDVSEKTGMTATAILQEVDAYQKSGKVSKELLPYIEKLTDAEYDLGRRAFKAAQEAKTFREALDATKDAVSTGWMNTFESIFGNYEEAKVLWTSLANGLWEVFASNGESRNMALKLWRNLGQRARLFNDELDETGQKIGAIYHIGGKFIELFDEIHGSLLKIFGPEVDPGEHEEDVWQLYTILTKVTDKIENFANTFEFFVDKLIDRDVIGKFVNSFHDIYMGIKVPLDAIKASFHGVFDPLAKWESDYPWANALVVVLNQISIQFRAITIQFRKFMESSETLEKFYDIGYGVMGILRLGADFLGTFIQKFRGSSSEIGAFGKKLLDYASSFGRWLQVLRNTINAYGTIDGAADRLYTTFSSLGIIVSSVIDVFAAIGMAFGNNISLVNDLAMRVVALTDAFNAWVEATFSDNSNFDTVLDAIYFKIDDFLKFFRQADVKKDLDKIVGALKSVFEIGGMLVSAVWKEFKKLLPSFEKTFKTVFHDFASLVDWITKIKNSLKESGALEKVFSTLGNVFHAFGAVSKVVYDILKAVFQIIGENLHVADGLGSKILDLINKFADWIKKLAESHDWGKKFHDTFSSVHGILEKVFGVFEKVAGFLSEHSPFELLVTGAKKAWEVIQKVFGYLKEGWNNLFQKGENGNNSPIENLGLLGVAALAIKKLLGKDEGIFGKLFGSDWKDLKKNFKETFESIGGVLDKFAGKKDELTKKLRNIAISLGILAIAIAVVANIDPGKIAVALATLTGGLAEMVGVIKLMNKLDIGGTQTNALLKVAAAMLAFGFALGEVAVAMVIFSAAVWIMSKIDPERLNGAILALVEGLAAMAAALFLLAKFCKGGDLFAAGTAILEVAAALDLLVLGVAVLSFLNPVKVSQALKELVAALAAMTLALLVLAKVCNPVDLVAAGTAILLVAAALDLVALALAGLSLMDSDKLMASVIVLGTMLAAIAVILALLGEVALPAIGAAFALVIVGAALDLIAVSMVIAASALDKVAEVLPKLAAGARSFEDVKWDAIAKAGAVLAGVIVALFALQFATIRDGTPALRELGEAMPILASGFKTFDILDPEAIERGGEALAAAIGALFKLQFSTLRDGTPELVKLGMAMPIIAMGFKTFEIVDGDAIAKAAYGLASAISSLFTLQFSTFRDGTTVLGEIGMVMPILAMGFQSFEGLDPGNLISVGNALSQTIKSLFNLQFASFKDGTTQLVNLGNSLPPLADGFRAFDGIAGSRIEELCTSLESGLKTLSGNVFKNLFRGDNDLTPVANGLTLLASAVNAIPENSADILSNLAAGIASAASASVKEVELLATKILEDLDKMVREADRITKELVPNMTKAVNVSKPSFIAALRSCVSSLQIQLSAMQTVLSSSINGCAIIVSSGIGVFYTYGYQMGTNLAQGIYDSVWQVQNAARALEEASRVENTNTNYNTGRQVATGLANGMTNNSSTKTVAKASTKLATTAEDTIRNKLHVRSPSRVMMEIGAFVSRGLALGIQNEGDEVEEAMITVINPLLAAVSQLMDEDYEFSPTIRPVVDMSNVDAMAGDISSLFAGENSYTVNAARRVAYNESGLGNGFGNYSSTVGDTVNATINVYATKGQDVNELARVIERRLVRINKQQQVGAL